MSMFAGSPGTPMGFQQPQVAPLGQPQPGAQTTQQITSGPLAPQPSPMGGQTPQSQILAQALMRMQQQPQGNPMGLGGNLLAQALLQNAYRRQQQAGQPIQAQMGMQGPGDATQPMSLPPMPQGGFGAGSSGSGGLDALSAGAGQQQGDGWGLRRLVQGFLGGG